MDRKGGWRLSPAYDLTFAYNPGNKWISKHQMSVNGKSSDIETDDLVTCGKSMGLSPLFCRKVISETETVVLNWLVYAEKSGIGEKRALEIRKILLLGEKAV